MYTKAVSLLHEAAASLMLAADTKCMPQQQYEAQVGVCWRKQHLP